jgi:hypothetical protein
MFELIIRRDFDCVFLVSKNIAIQLTSPNELVKVNNGDIRNRHAISILHSPRVFEIFFDLSTGRQRH